MVLAKSVVTALALGSALAAAAPTATQSGFTINQVAVPRTKARAAPVAEYARALRKFKANVPPTVAAAAESGTATNTPVSGDEEYITPVSAGKSTLNLDFDTGSADL
jgi:aspergillopepsin I